MNTINLRRSAPGVPFHAITLPSAEVAVASGGSQAGIPSARHHALRWTAMVGDVHTAPTVVCGTVFIGTADGTIHAVSTQSGLTRWQVALEGASRAPVVDDDIVFVSGGGRLHALDADDGSEVWSASLAGTAVFSDVTVDEGVLYVGDSEGYVQAIYPPTGERFWYTRVGAAAGSAPVVDGDLVHVRADDGTVTALHTATGEVMWQVQGGWTFSPSGPVVTEGLVVAAESGGTFQALDADTGIRRWEITVPGIAVGSPVTTGGTVIFATELPSRSGMITAVDAATGMQRWQLEIGAALASPLRMVGTTVYFGDAGGAVRMLDAATGGERWSYTRHDGQPASAPFILAHVLYLGSTVSHQVLSPGLTELMYGAQQAGTVRAYRLRLTPN